MPCFFLVFHLAFFGQVAQGPSKGRLEKLRDSTKIDLKIINPQFDPVSGRLTFAIRNDNSQPVEYVVLKYEATFSDGSSTWWKFGEPIEGGPSNDPGHESRSVLVQGDVQHRFMGVPRRQGVKAVDAGIRVQAVIYSDCSFQGDPETADQVFRKRELIQLVRRHWIDRLSRISDEADNAAMLRQALKNAHTGLKFGGDIYGNDRVSSQETIARSYSQKILGNKIKRLLQADDADLRERLGIFLHRLVKEFEEGRAEVIHDVNGIRIRR